MEFKKIIEFVEKNKEEYFKVKKSPYEVPEHVKQYDKHNHTYKSTDQTHRVWY